MPQEAHVLEDRLLEATVSGVPEAAAFYVSVPQVMRKRHAQIERGEMLQGFSDS